MARKITMLAMSPNNNGPKPEDAPLTSQIVIADSDEAARALAAPAYQRWFDTFTHLSRLRGLPLPPAPPATFEQATQIGFSISGSASTVRRILTAQASNAGINYLLCQIAFGTLPLEASLRTASAIASEIMPVNSLAIMTP
jgi:hypothetical protein